MCHRTQKRHWEGKGAQGPERAPCTAQALVLQQPHIFSSWLAHSQTTPQKAKASTCAQLPTHGHTAPHHVFSRSEVRWTSHKKAAGALKPLLCSLYLMFGEIFAMLVFPQQWLEPEAWRLSDFSQTIKRDGADLRNQIWKRSLQPPLLTTPSPSRRSQHPLPTANASEAWQT